jgi:hypothetical protein
MKNLKVYLYWTFDHQRKRERKKKKKRIIEIAYSEGLILPTLRLIIIKITLWDINLLPIDVT